MPIIVFQHGEESRPGRLGLTLRDQGHRLDIRRLDRNGVVPPDFDGVDGVISLGGPQSVAVGAERPAWMDAEIAFLKRAHELELPVVGICLGHQLIAAALGGEVRTMDRPEVGFHGIQINPAGQTETILAGIPWSARFYCHHNDHVAKLPPGALALASSKAAPVQAFKAGVRTYAFQHHFEADRDMIIGFARTSQDELQRAGIDESAITRQVQEHYDAFARLADRLCLNIATYLFPPVGMKQVIAAGLPGEGARPSAAGAQKA